MTTRAATFAAQREFPVGTTVTFHEQARERLGTVKGHEKGRLVIESPPYKRGGISKHLWLQVVRTYRIDPRNVKETTA